MIAIPNHISHIIPTYSPTYLQKKRIQHEFFSLDKTSNPRTADRSYVTPETCGAMNPGRGTMSVGRGHWAH